MSYCNRISTVVYFVAIVHLTHSQINYECLNEGILTNEKIVSLSKAIIPDLEGTSKGDAGKIGIIGGSVEYTGAPYFGAFTALRVSNKLVMLYSL